MKVITQGQARSKVNFGDFFQKRNHSAIFLDIDLKFGMHIHYLSSSLINGHKQNTLMSQNLMKIGTHASFGFPTLMPVSQASEVKGSSDIASGNFEIL